MMSTSRVIRTSPSPYPNDLISDRRWSGMEEALASTGCETFIANARASYHIQGTNDTERRLQGTDDQSSYGYSEHTASSHVQKMLRRKRIRQTDICELVPNIPMSCTSPLVPHRPIQPLHIPIERSYLLDQPLPHIDHERLRQWETRGLAGLMADIMDR